MGRVTPFFPEDLMVLARTKKTAAVPAPNPQTSASLRSGDCVADTPPDLGKEVELRVYRDMLMIRRFEERAGQMYGMGLIGGFCHLYIGQEAGVVGMQAALEEGDTIVTSYRDHGPMLACGMDPQGGMSGVTGRRCGYSPGNGRSMHKFSPEK